jgi:hypothetical protein
MVEALRTARETADKEAGGKCWLSLSNKHSMKRSQKRSVEVNGFGNRSLPVAIRMPALPNQNGRSHAWRDLV